MWVLQGNNVAKYNLTIMDANITWLTQKTNKFFGKLMQILWGENIIKYNMKYSYVDIIANKCYVYY
jgi:hypothetical protein